MIKKIAIAIFAFIIGVCVIAATRPSEFRVSRSASIEAAPSDVFPHINNLHKWKDWSPFVKMDPQAKYVVDGSGEGVGSSLAWDGEKSGAGKMTIVESRPGELVRMRLDFTKPFASTDGAEFTLKSDANQTLVTWTMSGRANFVNKVIGLFMDCDKMIGSEFEKGLSSMKTLVEGAAKKQ